MTVDVVELHEAHCDALLRFFGGLPEGDLTFIEEEVTDPDVVRSWAAGKAGGRRWVALDGDSADGGEDDGADDPRLPPPAQRRDLPRRLAPPRRLRGGLT